VSLLLYLAAPHLQQQQVWGTWTSRGNQGEFITLNSLT
jgi:hypothetical protein